MDIGTSKPGPEARAAVPHHLLDLVDPDEDFTVTQFQQAARRGAGRHRGDAGHHALLVGGTGLYLRAVVDDLAIPGRYPDVAAALEAELDEGRAEVGRPPRPAAPRSTRWRRRGWSRPTAAGSSAPSRSRSGRAGPSPTFGPGLEAYPAVGTAPGRAVARRPRRSTAASQPASPPWSRPAWSTRCGRWPPARPGSRARPARPWATARCWPTWRAAAPWRPAWRRRSGAPASSPAARPRGSAATRGSPGPGSTRGGAGPARTRALAVHG